VKTVLVLAFVALLGFILIHRRRVYVRDPLATVYKSAPDPKSRPASKSTPASDPKSEVKQSGVQVFINYSNDVLLEQDADPGGYRILVQSWNKMPGTPAVLKCLRWMVCLADADHATAFPIESSRRGRYDPEVTMTSRELSFIDADGATIRVELR